MSKRQTHPRHSLRGLLLLTCYAIWPSCGNAQPARGPDCLSSDLLPKSIVACAEATNLDVALQTVLTHPLRSKLQAMPAYDAVLQSGPLARLKMAVHAFEGSMGQPWQDAIAKLTDGGITIAVDASNGGVAVLVHSSDTKALERFRGFVLGLSQMQGNGTKQVDYREFTVARISDQVGMVQMHDWLVLTNKVELGKKIIDQYLDRGNDCLTTNAAYAAAFKQLESSEMEHRVVTAFLDVKALRDAGIAKDVFHEKGDNYVSEVVLGGILTNLRHTQYATGQLHLKAEGLSVQFATPHMREWESPREYYFGESEPAAAPPLLNVTNRLFAVSTHRDLSQMWLRAGDLLSDKANDQLAVAETALTTFFSGRDFGEDILGSLGSDLQIVGQAQDFTHVMPQPAIKLPAFALQFSMKNPEETQPELRRVFQSFIGFLNVTGAMNGQPQLDFEMETVGAAQIVAARYVPDRDKRQSLNAPIQFNFSPTIAFAGERIIFSSSALLARELIASKQDVDAATTAANTFAQLQSTTLYQILDANRSQLVANNMLEKGHGKEAAEGEIGLLLELLGFFRELQLHLDFTDAQMEFAASVDVATN